MKTEAQKAANRAYMHVYTQTSEYKAKRKMYMATPEYKAKKKEYDSKPERVAYRHRYYTAEAFKLQRKLKKSSIISMEPMEVME